MTDAAGFFTPPLHSFDVGEYRPNGGRGRRESRNKIAPEVGGDESIAFSAIADHFSRLISTRSVSPRETFTSTRRSR